MAEIVIAPNGADAVAVGSFVDDEGQKLVGIAFNQPGQDRVVVTFTEALFHDFARHLGRVSTELS